MKSFHSHTKFLCTFLFFCFFYTTSASAEQLLFKAGDKASYSIAQNAFCEETLLGFYTSRTSEAIFDLDLEILSSNQEAPNPSFEVLVTLRRIFVSENHNELNTFYYNTNYDSNNSIEPGEPTSKNLHKLINQNLVFKIDSNFQIEETTGLLADINEKPDSSSTIALFGATPCSFELLLTQLLHLSGATLLPSKVYPVNCDQFMNLDDELLDLDEKEVNIHQHSGYIVNSIDDTKIDAMWVGVAKIEGIEEDSELEGEVLVRGNVVWDIAHPLQQKRDLALQIEEDYYGLFNIKFTIQQKWKPVSSN